MRMTGMRMAQTRGGKKSWRGCPWSTNGWRERGFVSKERMVDGGKGDGGGMERMEYHE